MRASGEIGRERREEQTGGATDETEHLQPNPADDVGEHDGENDADDQQRGDQGRALGGGDVIGDEVGNAAGVIGIRADRGVERTP